MGSFGVGLRCATPNLLSTVWLLPPSVIVTLGRFNPLHIVYSILTCAVMPNPATAAKPAIMPIAITKGLSPQFFHAMLF